MMYAGTSFKFTSNTLLNVVVTADENSGNLYKQVYVRDNSGTFAQTHYYGAISLHFTKGSQSILNIGDSVAINLNGASLAKSSGGSLELDSIDPYHAITHLKTGLNPQPLMVTMPMLNTYSNVPGGGFLYDAQLVQMNNVEFSPDNVGLTYAIAQNPPAAPQNVNRFICDAYGNTIVAYNSGYANFASWPLIPNNSGTLTAVANLYTTMQLSLRSITDVQFTNTYNPVVYDTITQNFSCASLSSKATIESAGWKSIPYIGSLNWQGLQYGSPSNSYNPANWKYAPSASNFKSTDPINDMWLVSPPIVDNMYAHGGLATKYMDFSQALQYAANTTSKRCLSVMVTRNFDGTHIVPSDWQEISNLFGNIQYTSNQNSNGYPNFKYTHNSSYGSVYSPAHVPISVGGSSPTFYLAFRFRSNTSFSDSSGSTYLLGTLMLKNN